jgi:hypothetical protein
VDQETAQWIWEDCDQRAELRRHGQAYRTLTRKIAERGVQWGEPGEPNPLHQVPVQYRRQVVELGRQYDRRIPENLPEIVVYAIETMRDNRKALKVRTGEPMGLRASMPLPRLYGGRKEIIKAVAEAWGVTERTVRSIWERGDRSV